MNSSPHDDYDAGSLPVVHNHLSMQPSHRLSIDTDRGLVTEDFRIADAGVDTLTEYRPTFGKVGGSLSDDARADSE